MPTVAQSALDCVHDATGIAPLLLTVRYAIGLYAVAGVPSHVGPWTSVHGDAGALPGTALLFTASTTRSPVASAVIVGADTVVPDPVVAPDASSAAADATPENSPTHAPTNAFAFVKVTWIVVVADPPVEATPYQSSRSPTDASPPLDPRTHVTPPPEIDETVGTAPLGVDVDNANTNASPAATFDDNPTLTDDDDPAPKLVVADCTSAIA